MWGEPVHVFSGLLEGPSFVYGTHLATCPARVPVRARDDVAVLMVVVAVPELLRVAGGGSRPTLLDEDGKSSSACAEGDLSTSIDTCVVSTVGKTGETCSLRNTRGDLSGLHV